MGNYDSWKLATPPEYEFLGPDPDDEPEPDIDVCQNCGQYFEWTPAHAELSRKYGGEFWAPQRCISCIKVGREHGKDPLDG